MKDYSAMSDFEINGFVAASTQKIGDHTQARGLTFIHEYGEASGEFGSISLCIGWKEFDPCNNPTDAWPIIVENNISLHAPRFNEGWMAEFTGSDEDVNDGFDVDYFEYHNANPLRAAMIVYLQIMEQK